MKFKRTKCNCKDCPLDGQKKIFGTCGIEKPKVAFIGDMPWVDDVIKGEPFSGAAGSRLKDATAQAGLTWHTVHRTNLLLCKNSDRYMDSVEVELALECCKPGFEEELEFLQKQGVQVLVPLGPEPLLALGLEGKIGKMRGSVYQIGKQVAIPTFHPAFILRGMWKEEPTWIGDLQKVRELSLKKWKPPKENFNLFPSVQDVESFVENCLKKKILVGVDIETTSLSPEYSKILMIGLASSPEDVLVVPFVRQFGMTYWKSGEANRVWRALRKLMQNGRLVFQNAPFDTWHLERHGFPVGNVEEDTMLLHHCLTGETLVDTLEWGSISISQLEGKVGFHVVSWNGKALVPGKVKKCWCAGTRSDLVRITFWSKNRHDKDNQWIDCTSDHEFPIQGVSGKVQAKDIQPGMRLVPGMTNKGMIGAQAVHRWVYEQTHEPLGSLQVHHLDGNHLNNAPDNLKAVTVAEHNAYHKSSQYRATMTMMRKAVEKREEKVDVPQIKQLYYTCGLSYREVASYVGCSDHIVVAVLKHDPRGMRKRGDATRLRWEKNRNCRVLSVTPLSNSGERVFDIEVEKTHYFSANGVIVSNCINPELPHNLGYIVSVYGSTPYWKDVVLGNADKMIAMDDKEVRTYNARDCAVLLQVLPEMHKHLKEVGTERTYREISLKLIKPLRKMSDKGLPIDSMLIQKKKRQFERERKKALGKLMEYAALPEGFNLNSGDHLRLLIWGIEPKSAARVRAEKAKIDGNPKGRKDTKKYRELLEKLDVYDNTKPLYRTDARPRKTDGGSEAVDGEALISIERAALRRLDAIDGILKKKEKHIQEQEDIGKLLGFLHEYRKYADADKLASTFTGFPVWKDGRVHPSYKIHGTATGRLSSSDPNAQNIPGEVQDVFVAPENYVILKADYSNIELRMLAYIAGETVLIEAFESGQNIHDLNCKLLFGIDESNPIWKTARRAAKVFVFGRSYGGSVEGIYKQLIVAVPELGLTLEHFRKMDREYFQKLPRYSAWVNKMQAQARNTRCVETAFGRKRFLLGTPDEIERMALNTPIQGSASEVTLSALIELDEALEKNFPKAAMIATVHDSILVEVPETQALKVAKLMKKIMEKEYTIEGRKVRFPVDVEVGKSWGTTEPLEV